MPQRAFLVGQELLPRNASLVLTPEPLNPASYPVAQSRTQEPRLCQPSQKNITMV